MTVRTVGALVVKASGTVLFFVPMRGKYWPKRSLLVLGVARRCIYGSNRIWGTFASGDTNVWGMGAGGVAMAQRHAEQLQFRRGKDRYTYCGSGTSVLGVGTDGVEVQGLGAAEQMYLL